MSEYTKEEVKRALPIRDVLTRLHNVSQTTKKHIDCPGCGRKDKLWINTQNNTCGCYRTSCDFGGDSFALIARHHGLDNKTDFAQVLRIGAQMAGIASLNADERKAQQEQAKQQQEQTRRDEINRRQREHLATLSRQQIMVRFWRIIEDAPQTQEARAWLAGRGIDPDHAHEMGCRDWSTRQRAIDALLDKLTDDQLKDAGLLNEEGERWFPLREWSSPGLAVPCWHPGESAPYAYRWRLFEPWVNKDGKKTKTLQQIAGNDGQSHKGQVLGLHQAQDATHLVIVEGEPDWLSASQTLAHMPGVGVVGLCGISSVQWDEILAGHITHLTVCTHHDRDDQDAIKSPIDATRKTPNIFDRLATHLIANDLEVDVRVVDVRGDNDLNDQHQARELAWLVDAVEGSILPKFDFTGRWRRLFERTYTARLPEHERIAHTINTARPTQTVDTIKEGRHAQHSAMVADIKNGGVYVYASPCGIGKSTTAAPLFIEHVKGLAEHAMETESKAPRTIFAARSRDEVEATVQRLRRHASEYGELIRIANYQGRNAETCHEFDRYLACSKVVPMGGRHICTPDHGCHYQEGRKAMLAGVNEAHIIVTTHSMIPHLLEDCEESGVVVDSIVYDEGFDQQEHTVSVGELIDFTNQEDIDGAELLIELIERSKPTDDNPHHTINGDELVTALEAITINSDSAKSIAGACALEELLIDGAARETATLPQWQTLDALALAKETGGVGARAHNGELCLPLKARPDYLKARAVFILDASATELSSRLIYGGERTWRRFAPKPNEHVYHFHIRMPFSKRAVAVDGENIEYSSKTVELCLEVARWLADIWPGETLFAGRKDWYGEDGNTPLWDGPSTWIGSALAKGSNDFKDCTSCVCADYRAAGHTLDAYANTLRALAIAQGLEIDPEVFALEAQIKHELTHLEQIAGRIRAIMASEDTPQMIITMGSGPAPYLEYVGHTSTINSDDVLLNFYGIVKPSTQLQFLENLCDKIGGLPLSSTIPSEWLKSALYAEGTPFLESYQYILGLFQNRCPFTEKYKSHGFKETSAYQNHGQNVESQLLKVCATGASALTSTYINHSNSGRPVPWMMPRTAVLETALQSYATARGWSWFEVYGERYVLSDGQWITRVEHEHKRAHSTLEHLNAVGIKQTTSTGEIYSALETFWQCGERGRKRGLRELFGGLSALRDLLLQTPSAVISDEPTPFRLSRYVFDWSAFVDEESITWQTVAFILGVRGELMARRVLREQRLPDDLEQLRALYRSKTRPLMPEQERSHQSFEDMDVLYDSSDVHERAAVALTAHSEEMQWLEVLALADELAEGPANNLERRLVHTLADLRCQSVDVVRRWFNERGGMAMVESDLGWCDEADEEREAIQVYNMQQEAQSIPWAHDHILDMQAHYVFESGEYEDMCLTQFHLQLVERINREASNPRYRRFKLKPATPIVQTTAVPPLHHVSIDGEV